MNIKSKRVLKFLLIGSSITLAASVYPQSQVSYVANCYDAGSNALEPLGDRPGHAIQTGQFICIDVGGPMDGAVETGTYVWEWDKTAIAALVLTGIVRKPGSMAVFQDSESKATAIMSDGKITGFTGSGRGKFLSGAGAAANWSGRSYSYTFQTTGFNQSVVGVRIE